MCTGADPKWRCSHPSLQMTPWKQQPGTFLSPWIRYDLPPPPPSIPSMLSNTSPPSPPIPILPCPLLTMFSVVLGVGGAPELLQLGWVGSWSEPDTVVVVMVNRFLLPAQSPWASLEACLQQGNLPITASVASSPDNPIGTRQEQLWSSPMPRAGRGSGNRGSSRQGEGRNRRGGTCHWTGRGKEGVLNAGWGRFLLPSGI